VNKKYLTVFLLMLLLSVIISAQEIPLNVALGDSNWFTQTSGTTRVLDDVFFLNDTMGWTVGDVETLLKTTNGGDNWYPQNTGTPINKRLTDVYFVNEDYGWIVRGSGYSSSLLKTNNGGITWFEINTGYDLKIGDIFFWDSNVGWCVGTYFASSPNPNEAIILKSTDGGSSWTQTFSDTSDVLKLWGLCFVDSLTGWAAGEVSDPWGSKGAVYKTSDGGVSWFEQTDTLESLANDIQFIDDSTGWVVGSAIGFVAKSTNGGTTWNTQKIGTLEWYNSVIFIDIHTGWITGSKQNVYEGIILKTADGGATWDYQINGEVTPLTSIHFSNEYYGWAVGTQGTILHTTNGGVTFIEDNHSNFTVEDYILSQNYPNPFNPTTSFQFRISNFEFVNLKVYDVLGNEIATLVDEEKPAGEYEVNFSGNGLTSGVYFYQLRAGSFIETKKMLLIK
jgi:photosystem II stability/assembly factor-like uncharacterized protein